ncbi:hypothetical protein [Spirosoma aerophilum]
MNGKTLVGLSLFLLPLLAHGQSPTSETNKKSVYLNSVLGIAAPGLSDLNTQLKQSGFLPLSGLQFSRGAGFYTIFPKARLATLFSFVSYSGTNTEANRSSWVRGSTAGTSLGFVIRNTDRLQLIPNAGVVYSWFGTRVSKQASGSSTVDGYLNGPSDQQYIGKEQFLFNIGLHIAKPGFGQSGLAQKLMVGLRAGYLTPFNQAKWKTSNATTLSGGPSINPGGAYAHLIIGTRL